MLKVINSHLLNMNSLDRFEVIENSYPNTPKSFLMQNRHDNMSPSGTLARNLSFFTTSLTIANLDDRRHFK
jgi:hypothetical protein